MADLVAGSYFFWTEIFNDENVRGRREMFTLPPLEQYFNRCSVAATVRQLDYLIRGDLISSGSSDFFTTELFNHENWHSRTEQYVEVLRTGDPDSYPVGLNPEQLLNFAIYHGVSCNNGFLQKIDRQNYIITFHRYWNDENKFSAIKSFLDMQIPVIGVMNIDKEAYQLYGNLPYVMKEGDDDYDPFYHSKAPKHAIVILGYYTVHPDAIAVLPQVQRDKMKDVKPGNYLVYQESRREVVDNEVVDNSLMGMGLNIVHPRYIIEALHGGCNLQNVAIRNQSFINRIALREAGISYNTAFRDGEDRRIFDARQLQQINIVADPE